MADWLVGPLMGKIIDKCSDYFEDQFKSQIGMKEELERLRINYTNIQSILTLHNKLEIKNPHLNKWYWHLRDAIDDADNVLDDLEYRKHVSKTKKKRKFFEILKNDPDLKKLEEAVQKLDKISAEVSLFLHLLDSAKQEEKQEQVDLVKKRETGAVIKNVLLGRSKDMELILRWLRNPFEIESADTTDLYRNISLLSVVGHGGMGKTTLLQHVYKDSVTTMFDVKIWVCVSTHFDAKTVIKNILESVQNHRPDSDSLAVLQNSLQTKVRSKRFLLVLDDIWEADEEKWENVLAPLQDGNPGSKILITTRMNSVASKIPIENKEIFQIKGLEEKVCFELFKTHAFGKNSNINVSLLPMAEDIVKKLSGSPLAAKIVGSSLKSKDVSYWRKILHTDFEILGQNDIFPILKLSYTYLPHFLQICFAFCCIFDQDYKFDKDELVRMWISLDFIQVPPNNSRETIEEIGRSYFDILVEKSFFDEFESQYDGGVYYQMHDLLHDLAQSVSKQECFRAMDVKELSIPPKTIRHLSLDIHGSLEAVLKKMGDLKNLRSLFLFYQADYDVNYVDVLSKILEASQNIHLLYIFAPSQREITDMIGCLTHLRYVYLYSAVNQLPRSISQLYHLQILICMGYNKCDDDFLPKDINNLYNLCYLRLPIDENCMIYEIGKLNSLRDLNCFYAKNEIGYGIEELEHMNKLCEISIHHLENIKVFGESWSAKFSHKKKLTNLSLQWGNHLGNRKNIVDYHLDEKVIDGFEPYNNTLNSLKINAYMGVRSAIWMNNIYVISNLEYIKLEHCLNWKYLPSFGQLPFLKSLFLHNMPEVEQLDHSKDCKFPLLEVLHIKKLKALKEWFDTTLAAAEVGSLFPCLTKLCLMDCPKLQELPSSPSNLHKLEMDNIGWKGCKWLQGIRNCCNIDIKNSLNIIRLTGRQELKTNENFELIIDELVINDHSLLLLEPLRNISSLRILEIKQNDELFSFPVETEQWFVQLSSSIFESKFNILKSLQSLPSSLERLSSLKTLRVSFVPHLKLLPNPPGSLVTLKLDNLESLLCLPSFLPTLLRILTINKVPRLLELPYLPSSLERLDFENLKSLQSLPSSISNISSLKSLKLKNIPLLQSLPDLPSSLERLDFEELKSLYCLPYSFSNFSSLKSLKLIKIPLLQSLPDLPSSLKDLELEALQCLPSFLLTFSSLRILKLKNIPLLKSLPDLPSSLSWLYLEDLENLDCLSSCLPISLHSLSIQKVPRLLELPDLPSSLSCLILYKVPRLLELPDLLASLTCLNFENCHPQLLERYPNFFRRQEE